MADFERNDARRGGWGEVVAGVLLVPLLHVLAGVALAGLAYGMGEASSAGWVRGENVQVVFLLAVAWLMAIGLSQLLYVGPVAAVALVFRRRVGIGMLIGMGLTLALNGTCYGLFGAAALGW